MNPILGKDVLIKIYKGGDFYDYACATDITIRTTTEMKEVKTVGDGFWAVPRPQKNSYTITLGGVIVIDEDGSPAAFDLIEYQKQMTALSYQIFFTDPSSNVQRIRGQAYVSDSDLGGGSDGFATGSFTLIGKGPYIAAPACEAEITGFTHNTIGVSMHLDFTATADTAYISYTVTGGGVWSGNTYAPDFSFIVPKGVGGFKEITATPYCESDEPGEEFTDSWTA